ncbi:MAG: Serine protease, subtilase family [Parcubacteria group bacterium GW2011_GWA2_51_10]|nr:MAG: Serine protease, subtilase family [Parcubacteria group bacterium GW2011_GWA2_51_10]
MKQIIVSVVALFVIAGIVTFAIPALTLAVAEGQGSDNLTRVLIAFDKPVGPSEQAIVRTHGGKIKYSYSIVNAIAATLPSQAIEGLSHNPHVVSVELDDTVFATDIELDNSWGVKHIGAGTVHTGSVQTGSANKGAGVKIGIIDSGVNYNHPDLNANYRGGYDFYYYDNDPMDVYGHGTHVAGTACAEDNDNGTKDKKGKPLYGVVGVAPNCDLYALRVLSDSGVGYWSDIIAAVDWSTGGLIYLPGYWDEPVGAPEEPIQGVKMDVINLSLGKDTYPGTIVEQAFTNAEASGVVIVAAAGNSGNTAGTGDNVIYPAKFASVIAVAATDSADKRASFSSTGPKVELAAPGVSVYSTWNDKTSYANPQPKCNRSDSGCYKYGSGTSMASPHVAGVAALIIASGLVSDTNGTNGIYDEVRARLNATATDMGTNGRDAQYGYGLVNAIAAVQQ